MLPHVSALPVINFNIFGSATAFYFMMCKSYVHLPNYLNTLQQKGGSDIGTKEKPALNSTSKRQHLVLNDHLEHPQAFQYSFT